MAEVTNPVKMDEITVKKIEDALMMDCSIKEVCLFANITKQTYYNWIESFPELKERFDFLKENNKLKAKKNISNKLDTGDVDISKWYLERRDKQFAAKQEVGGIDGENLKIELVNYADTIQLPAEKISDTTSSSY